MSDGVTLLLTDPEATVVETEGAVWAVSGSVPGDLRELLEADATPATVRDRLFGRADDCTVVRVAADPRGGAVDAYRSPTATRDLYRVRADGGGLVLADHFRNALRQLPVGERRVPRAALADHLLYRAPVEPLTYVAGVRAVPHGAWLRWDRADGEPQRAGLDVLSPSARVAPGEATARIDGTLSAVLADGTGGGTGEVRTMFSGGVDSTLLATYLDEPRPTVMALDSPELAFECEYAERALSLLGATADWVELREADLLDGLEASVDALGYPSHYGQTVLTDALFREVPAGRFLNAEGADALFGLTGAKGARVADLLASVLSRRVAGRLPGRALDRLPDGLGGPAATYLSLVRTAERLDRPVVDPDSFACRLGAFADPATLADLLGEEAVVERCRRHVGYVRRRVPLPARPGYARQAAVGHLLAYLRHNTVPQWRQLAAVHGHALLAPFGSRRLAECALGIPVEGRYVRRPRGRASLATKPHLKSLLAGRLPGYDVTKPKGSGSLPVRRYVESGPLAGAFDRYPPPAFVGDDAIERHVGSVSPATWSLLTLAVWRDRVLAEPDLAGVPGTRRVEVPARATGVGR